MDEHNSGAPAAAEAPAGTTPEAPAVIGGPPGPVGGETAPAGGPWAPGVGPSAPAGGPWAPGVGPSAPVAGPWAPASPAVGGPPLAPAPAPSAWSGRRIVLLIGGIFGGVIAFIAVISLLAIFVVVPMWRASSPDWLVMNAARRLESAPALHARGTFLDVAGRRVELDVRVGEDRFAGTQRIDGHRAEIRSARGKTYVKGAAGFWTIVLPDRAGPYADRWVLTGATGLRLQVDPYLEPKTLARALRGEHDQKVGKGVERRVHGVDTMRIALPSGGAVYVARQDPYGIVRIESPIVGGGSGSSLPGYALDIDELSTAEADEFNAGLRNLPKETAGAIDPNHDEQLPAYYVVHDVIDADDECGAVSCQFEAKVKNMYGPARPGTKHLLMGVVWEGKSETVNGKVIGRCETTLKPLAQDAVAQASCVMSDPRWASWIRNSPGWYTWSFTTFNPGWDGATPAVMGQLIERRMELDHIDEVSSEAGGAGLRTLARLVRYPGISDADGVAIVNAAASSGQLDLLQAYADSGRIGNPKGLRRYLETMSAERHTIASSLPRSNQFQAAVARAKDGKGPVAVQSWTGGGVTVKADIVDVGRKEAVQLRTIVSKDNFVVVSAVASAVSGFTAPATFRRVLDLRIANQDSPLYSLGKAELRDALRKEGMKAPVDVVIVNGAGRHEYGSADFR